MKIGNMLSSIALLATLSPLGALANDQINMYKIAKEVGFGEMEQVMCTVDNENSGGSFDFETNAWRLPGEKFGVGTKVCFHITGSGDSMRPGYHVSMRLLVFDNKPSDQDLTDMRISISKKIKGTLINDRTIYFRADNESDFKKRLKIIIEMSK